jgi:HD-GYP domain-containing protein (c-di-GMP phosphodiesterase class II)
VAIYALILADAVGVDDQTRRTIELAALFHDIGKIHGALFDIIHEPGELTPAERRAIATHPKRGADVLAPIANFYPELAEAVLAHHERWDGSGYPRALRGRRIPLAARVVALADTFDAVAHGRRYRHGRTVKEAAKILMQGRGTQFDPDLVDLMLFPPVFARLTQAHRRWIRRGNALPDRRDDHGMDSPPNVRIRWRSTNKPRKPVRERIAGVR